MPSSIDKISSLNNPLNTKTIDKNEATNTDFSKILKDSNFIFYAK